MSSVVKWCLDTSLTITIMVYIIVKVLSVFIFNKLCVKKSWLIMINELQPLSITVTQTNVLLTEPLSWIASTILSGASPPNPKADEKDQNGENSISKNQFIYTSWEIFVPSTNSSKIISDADDKCYKSTPSPLLPFLRRAHGEME